MATIGSQDFLNILEYFTGVVYHSHNFKKAAPFAGKRVLGIG